MTDINTCKAYSKTETVSVPDLVEGDLIAQHGGVFRVTNRRDWDDSETVTFDGVFVEDAFSDQRCSIPAHWRQNTPRTTDRGGCDHGYWQVQGNQFAKVARITDDTPLYFWGWDDVDRGLPIWRDYSAPIARVQTLQRYLDSGLNWLGRNNRRLK